MSSQSKRRAARQRAIEKRARDFKPSADRRRAMTDDERAAAEAAFDALLARQREPREDTP